MHRGQTTRNAPVCQGDHRSRKEMQAFSQDMLRGSNGHSK